MQPRHQFGERDRQMLVSSPRCALNCQGLSLHLPPLGEGRNSTDSSYLSPPMSASFSRPQFDDFSRSRPNDYCYQGSPSSLRLTPSKKLSAGITQTSEVNKPQIKNLSNCSSTPTSAEFQSPGAVRIYREPTSDEHTASNHDSVESQLVPGPPGIARRAKAHVPSACVNCKKKHLACETKRPCNRCMQTGKEASCVDVQHKKRGRPRLREDESFREAATGAGFSIGDAYQDQDGALPGSHPGRHRSKTYRELRSQPEAPYVDKRPRTSDSAFFQQQYPQATSGYPHSRSASSFFSDQIPTVLLTPEFVVTQHNRAFSNALCLPYIAKGHGLLDLVVPAEKERVQRLQSIMRSELREAAHAAPMRGDSLAQASIPAIESLDIAHATAGFRTRSEYWTFCLPREQSRGFPISISLAKEGAQFVVLTLVQSASVLHALQSPPLGQILHNASGLSSEALHNMPTPPQSSHSNHRPTSHHHQHHRNHSSDLTVPFIDQQPLAVQPHSLGQYRHKSPPRSVQGSYDTPRTSSSGSASGSNSDIPRSSPGHHHPSLAHDNLRHLQLPPIRTTPTSDPTSSRHSGHRKKSNTPSPARGSPHSAKRKKRRRVDIGEMLH